MDWWIDTSMNKQERTEVSGLVAEQLERALAPLHKQLDATPQETETPPSFVRQHPFVTAILIGVLGSAIGGLAVAKWQAGNGQDDERLSLRLAAEVNKQLDPLRQQLQRQGEDIAKIKGATGIAKGPSSGSMEATSPLQAFVKMDKDQLSRELGKLSDVAVEAHKTGAIEDLATIDAIQKKLAAVPLSSPDAIRAVSATINYASFAREKTNTFPYAPQVRKSICEAIHIEKPPPIPTIPVDGFEIRGCTQRIDNGVIWRNGTFTHVIIIWDGDPIRLENVKFINCLFVVSLPVNPTAPAKEFAGEILAKNTGPTPNFSVSVGLAPPP